MTMADEYVRLRASGMGSREAARQAGFSGGVPSPMARELWATFRIISDAPVATLRHIPEKIARTQETLGELLLIQRAIKIRLGGVDISDVYVAG